MIEHEQTYDEFFVAASQPSPETSNEGGGTQGVGEGCEFSGPCDDIWYFKRSVDDNGRGLVIFKGVLSEEDIMDELDERDTVRRESKKKSAGPRGFKVKSRKASSAKRKSIGGEGVLDGVYQRCGELFQILQWSIRDEAAFLTFDMVATRPAAPYMMLWQDEREGTQVGYSPVRYSK